MFDHAQITREASWAWPLLSTQQPEALPLPGEWFIGVEILRKSVLTPIHIPLGYRTKVGGSLSNEYKRKIPNRIKDPLPSELLCG